MNHENKQQIYGYVLVSIFLTLCAWAYQTASAGGRKAAPTIEKLEHCTKPPPKEKSLVYLGSDASSIFKEGGSLHGFIDEAYCYLNTVYANGCLERKVLEYSYKTLESAIAPQFAASENKKAWDAATKNAPFSVDATCYTKRFTKVIGYTFNWVAGLPELGSETHIWTNFRMMGGPAEMAAHTAHEIAHQARAHGFGHWSRFDGSFPYANGEHVVQCIEESFAVKVNMLKAVDLHH